MHLSSSIQLQKLALPVSSLVHVLAVAAHQIAGLLQRAEVEEVGGAMDLVVELLGVGQLELVAHARVMAHAWDMRRGQRKKLCCRQQTKRCILQNTPTCFLIMNLLHCGDIEMHPLTLS